MAQNATLIAPFTLTNSTWVTLIGQAMSANYLDGYIANFCLVDNAVKAPSDFAYTDPNGQWRSLSKAALQAVANAGGTASFFLPFDNGSSLTTLGADASSKGNNWTLTNMVRDGSVNDCWNYDTPTNNFAVGSNVDCDPQVSNFAASGAMHWMSPSGGVFWRKRRATMPLNGSNRYWECTCMVASGTYYGAIGVLTDAAIMHDPSNFTGGYLYGYNGQKYINGTASAFGASFTINDIISFYYDDSLKTLDCYKNNVLQGTISLPGSVQLFAGLTSYGQSFIVNFGQQSFVYTPPTGAKALSTKNLPDGSVTTSGSFTGNVAAEGPFVWLNGTPTAMTINGNAVTFGTHADKLANGFKLRTSSTSYNNSGSNTYSVTSNAGVFKYNNAEGNP